MAVRNFSISSEQSISCGIRAAGRQSAFLKFHHLPAPAIDTLILFYPNLLRSYGHPVSKLVGLVVSLLLYSSPVM